MTAVGHIPSTWGCQRHVNEWVNDSCRDLKQNQYLPPTHRIQSFSKYYNKADRKILAESPDKIWFCSNWVDKMKIWHIGIKGYRKKVGGKLAKTKLLMNNTKKIRNNEERFLGGLLQFDLVWEVETRLVREVLTCRRKEWIYMGCYEIKYQELW